METYHRRSVIDGGGDTAKFGVGAQMKCFKYFFWKIKELLAFLQNFLKLGKGPSPHAHQTERRELRERRGT